MNTLLNTAGLFAKDGLTFVFGPLMSVPEHGFIFALQVAGIIVFIAAFINILTYLGITGFVVNVLGMCVYRITRTSKTESVNCAANVFFGQETSPILIEKYLPSMTRSEVFTISVAGMSSMSVSVLGGYHAMGIPLDFLIIASSLVPFGAIAVSKILEPETLSVQEQNRIEIDRKSVGNTFIEALTNGAMTGVKVTVAICASLIAMIALVSMVNDFISPFDIRIEQILGYLLYPLAFLMGTDCSFIQTASELLGSKLALNEFYAFEELVKHLQKLDYRTQTMLCVGIAGFANISSMAITASVIGTLCPQKKSLIASIAP